MKTKINFINPKTGNSLVLEHIDLEGVWFDQITKEKVAPVIKNIPRFVLPKDNYAETFGWQWKKWRNNQSQSRGSSVQQKQLILDRTHFAEYDLDGKTILECGMGGGDDTEVLLDFPFAEVHSFDISTSVERAYEFLKTERLIISQASIYDIPYSDEIFDFVFCHRVLQHTPDPEQALRCICKKVKKNGVLFIHSYKKSQAYMKEWRYKYRFITTRIPMYFVYLYVTIFGKIIHKLAGYIYKRGGKWQDFAYQYIPWYWMNPSGYYDLQLDELIELEKMITFDALTPKYDFPMATEKLVEILTEEGFSIDHLEDSFISPVYATARKLESKK